MSEPEGPPFRVLRIIARLNVGGPAKQVLLLQDALSVHGFDTLLLYGHTGEHEASFDAQLKPDTGRAIQIPALGRAVRPFDDVRAFAAILRVIFTYRPDIIHTHTAKAGTLGRLAGALFNAVRPQSRRALVVHTFHGHVFSGYFGRLGSRLVRIAESVLSRFTDAIVAVSDLQALDLHSRYAVAPARKVSVIPLGFDLKRLLQLPPPTAVASTMTCTYVGRLVPIKDLGTLMRGFALAARAAEGLQLEVVGDGEMRHNLEDLATELGIARRAAFRGWRADLDRVYRGTDVVVLTSLNEGTPVALIEAMAAARPVVATDVGGVRDVVVDETTGIVIPPQSPESVARALLRLYAEPATRRAMGEAGRHRAARFASTRLADDLAQLYVTGLHRKRGTRASVQDDGK